MGITNRQTQFSPDLLQLLKNKRTLVAFFLLVLNHIQIVIKRTFVSILLNEGLGFSKAAVSLFPAVDSAVMLTVFVLIMPALTRRPPRGNVALGLVASTAGYGVLALTPGPIFPLAILGTVLAALGNALERVVCTVEWTCQGRAGSIELERLVSAATEQ